MPASKLFGIENTSLQLALWHITESLPQCIALANEYHIPITHLSHPERIRQYVTSRLLLLQTFPHIEPVFVSHKGPPEIKNPDMFISFSHTRAYSSLVLSQGQKAGIDMECDREKIFRIHPRFCSPEEESYAQKNVSFTKEIICILWCIKEAVFKKYHHLSLNFKTQIFVPEFLPVSDTFIIPVIIFEGENSYQEKCYIEKVFNHWLAVV
jgi:phosphopantetheinyl transferase